VIPDPKRIVREGYDRLGDAYRPEAEGTAAEARGWFLGETLSRIATDADVLELGCGPGWDARSLARGRRYVGVDLSPTMIALAKERVPSGTFLEGDLARIHLPSRSFDAVVALYVMGHIPSDEHRPVYRRIASWLRTGAVFCASFPLSPGDDVEDDWLGVPMFFGGVGREMTEKGLIDAGFVIELAEERDDADPEGGTERFLWVIARRR
jgi:SAM-dependent methyltransferase